MNVFFAPFVFFDPDGGAKEKVWLECGVAVDASMAGACAGRIMNFQKSGAGGDGSGGGGGG
ncbi:MAG: hypothetical protein ACRD4O_04155, partial [Bryobacteraceae bacterium]